jgi:glutamate/tyrosine decarboxylase-like PLP-dependent enzyme
MLHGLAPFRAALEEKMLLARYFHEKLSAAPRFELGPYPDLSVVTFRYLPENGDPDEFNKDLVGAIHRDGRIFISSTMIDGRFTLRFAAVAFRTHLHTVDLFLEILHDLVEEVCQQ